MALSDGRASIAQVEAAQKLAKERERAAAEAAAVQAARTSVVRVFQDAAGNSWHYVVLDDASVRIERCECACEEFVIPSELEGLPVVALATEACAGALLAQRIGMPDSVISNGFSAFRAYYDEKELEYAFTSDCKMTLPASELTGKRVLDVGCRRGRGVYKISSMVGNDGFALGTDWVESYIQEAARDMGNSVQAALTREENFALLASAGFAEPSIEESSEVAPDRGYKAGETVATVPDDSGATYEAVALYVRKREF